MGSKKIEFESKGTLKYSGDITENLRGDKKKHTIIEN